MKESFWAMMVVGLGIVSILFIYYFQSVTNTSEHNYELVKECKPWLEKISTKLEIYDKHVNANTVYAILKKRLESMGKFVETDTKMSYIPNNPNLISACVIGDGEAETGSIATSWHLNKILNKDGNPIITEINE